MTASHWCGNPGGLAQKFPARLSVGCADRCPDSWRRWRRRVACAVRVCALNRACTPSLAMGLPTRFSERSREGTPEVRACPSSWEIALNGALIARLTPPAGGFGFHDRESYQAIFCRRRHQPRRPPPAKTRPGNSAPAMGLHVITAIALVPFILISIPCCCALVLVSPLAEVSSRFQT